MTTNLTFMDTSNTLADVMNGINYSTSGLIVLMLMIMVFVISYVAFKNYPTSVGFISSSFVTLIVGSLIYFMSWTGGLGFYVIGVPLLLLMIGIVMNNTG